MVLRDQSSENDDIDILVNNYFLFKRLSDCHSYKLKNLNFIGNAGDPVDENGFKVSNYILIKNKKINLDIRFVGDNYLDEKWQKKILKNREFDNIKFIPNSEDFKYSLLYNIIFNKGFIANKYTKFLKEKFKLKELHYKKLNSIINNYMLLKNYKYKRPSDLTMPITFELNSILIKEELCRIKDQIKIRNSLALIK